LKNQNILCLPADMGDKKIIAEDFIKIITQTIIDFNMLEQEDTVLVGVSGGPDSVALILSLLPLKEKYQLKLGIAHLNHMLRGEESQRDETFAKAFAEKLELMFYCEQIDLKPYAKKHRLSIEEAGRKARYKFFKQTAKTHGYTKIATGHNKDDNAELILMNLLRGAGSKGLSGIPPIRNNKYIRPLIRVTKNQILSFLKAEKQTYVFDSSNKDIAYLRNKIRYELIPHLQSEYNPEIIVALDRLSNIFKQEEEFWDIETQKAFKSCLIKTDVSSIKLSINLMSKLHPAILNRVLREAIRKIKKDLKRISFVHINDIVKFCFNNSSGFSLDLPGQIRIYKNMDTVIIKKENIPLREIGKKEKQLRQMAQKKQGK